MILSNLPNILSVVVGVIVLMRGGRYERLVIGFLVLRGALLIVAQLFWWPHKAVHDSFYFALMSVPQGVLLLALAWLAGRHHARWLRLLVALQAARACAGVAMAFAPGLHAQMKPLLYVLALGETACLAWALLLHSVGPPAPVPGQEAFDAYRAASARPGRQGD